MMIIPNERIRKYVAYSAEEGGWIHDPKMPEDLEEEFKRFKEKAEAESKMPITLKYA